MSSILPSTSLRETDPWNNRVRHAPKQKEQSRILIASNRLPVSMHHRKGKLEFLPSTGGLATGLRSLPPEYSTMWIGWPGVVSNHQKEEVRERLTSEFHAHPVFLAERLVQKYYEGFSNRTIWPLFHSFPAFTKYSASEWEAYQEVNVQFCEAIAQLAHPNDLIWIHDYHLMTLPRLLKDRLPKTPIGFFLHIPFPHYDILRLLPQHRQLMENLLGSDLIGFHTYEYAHSFLGSVRRIFGLDNNIGQILVGDRSVQVDVFPMGIDFEKFSSAAQTPGVVKEMSKIQKKLGPAKLVFSLSRLDYTKGIPESLEALEEFYKRYPDWHGKVNFLLVVVPSREKVDRYAELKKEIDEVVGRINSKYGKLDWTPIRYIYRSLSFEELVAVYADAEVAFITPLRDGMNLVAKEYLASKRDDQGVLILSEMAGASKELLEAIVINPNSKEEAAEALHQALLMPEEEQIERTKVMRERLRTHDIRMWVERFFARLRDVLIASKDLSIRTLDEHHQENLVHLWERARHRLIVLDYDGTLVPFAEKPHLAKPDSELLELLGALSKTSQVVILSGRDRETLDSWFGGLNIRLVAEHGGWVRHARGAKWEPTIGKSSVEWKQQLRPVLQLFVDRIPGSWIEEKDFSLVWHYRKAHAESASTAAKELLDTLMNFATNLQIRVLPGNKSVEVRDIGISKGTYFTHHLANEKPDFILAIGDDWTDEDLFAVLPESAYSIKVGLRVSRARFNLESIREVRQLLTRLSQAS